MRNARVLLVEDEPLVRLAVAEGLRDDGFDVVEAGTGCDAIRLLGPPVHFDALCTDVRMPGPVDGIAVAIRARGWSPRLPVVVVSGYASELGQRLALFDPPLAFLSKPFTVEELSSMLRNLLLSPPATQDQSAWQER